jgi:WS/DGAT/MGAT family acyltransferase
MKRLGMMDAAFLYMETPNAPTHASALQLFEPPSDGRDFFETFRLHLEERIPRLPHLHQHLQETPLELDHPVWVANDDIDLSHHLRRERLEAPGTMEQLTRLCERLYPPLLDRSRPLWEYTVIEGLANGQIAVFMKAHHACMDGMAAQATFDVFFSPTPEQAPLPALRHAHAEADPGFFPMLRDAYGHLAEQPRRALRALPEAARSLARLGERFLAEPPEPAPRTRFDVSVTERRRFEVLTLSLARVRAVAKRRGATVNDVVMALCGAALRRYLESHDELPEESLVAFAPVSLRPKGDGDANNQVFGMMAPLATDVGGALERLDAVREGTARAKALVEDMRDLVPGDFAMPGVAALVPGFFRLMSDLHLQERMPQLYNVTVSNVPGIRHPIYMSGARLVAEYPMSIVQDGSALNITVMGIEDALDFGLVACAKAVPDVDVIGALLADAFEELERAVASA